MTCIDVQGNIARIAGTWRDGGSFGLYVEDNGNGDGTDTIALTPDLADCAEDREDEPTRPASLAATLRSGTAASRR